MAFTSFDSLKKLEPYRNTHFKGEWPTLVEMLQITAERYGDRRGFTSFQEPGIEWTYGEVYKRVRILGSYLHSKGVKRGVNVGLTGKNSPEWALSYLGILFAGGTIIPIDYALSEEEAAGLLETAEVEILFVGEEKYDFFEGKEFKELISLSPEKKNYVVSIEHEEVEEIDLPEESDIAAILFTSGTTGVAKGVMLSHANLISDANLATGHLHIFPTDVFYALLPLHHSYSMLAVFIEALSHLSEIFFAKSLAVGSILEELKKGNVTMLLAIPMLFNKIIKGLMKGIREKGILVYLVIRGLMYFSEFFKKSFGINLGKILFKGILGKVSLATNRICISGGGPLPATTVRLYNQLGVDFVQGYGLTETSPILTLNPKEAYKAPSVGKVLPQLEMIILEPDEKGCGEIAVKGPVTMQGYYKDEAATKEIFTEDGFLKTGDIGYLDSENYLYITGRAKSMIVSEGGKNIFPEEIEDKFQLYDEIEQVMIRGYLKDEAMKREGIEALIYPNEENRERGKEYFEEIVKEVNQKLKPYQKISKVELLSEPMEMTTTKKIKRFKVEKS